MSRIFRAFMVAYAGAMIAIGVGMYFQSRPSFDYVEFFYAIGSAALCYVALALGYLGSKPREQTPGRPWLAVVYVLALSLPAAALLSGTPITSKDVVPAATLIVSVLACLAATILLLLDLGSEPSLRRSKIRRWLVPPSLVVGAGLVFSSVFLKVTNEGTGWEIITRKAAWITSGINVGTPLFFGHTIQWLQPIYAPGGYAFYLLGLAATVVLLIRLAVSRGSVERMQRSSTVTWCAALLGLASLWILTDIFWGWHFDLSSIPWAAAVATCLWLAGPLFGAVLLAPFVRGKPETWRLRALLVFQLPIAAFNFLMLFAYYGGENLDIPGLGMLIIGLQLESWACMELLAHISKTKPVLEEIPDRVTAMAA